MPVKEFWDRDKKIWSKISIATILPLWFGNSCTGKTASLYHNRLIFRMGIPTPARWRLETNTCSQYSTLQWHHNERDCVSNHRRHDCLLNRLFRRRSNKTSKLRVTDLCGGNSLLTDEFPARRASNTENVSIWWHHYEFPWQSLNPWRRSYAYAAVNYAIIVSDNDLSPYRRQAIIWTNAGLLLTVDPWEHCIW